MRITPNPNRKSSKFQKLVLLGCISASSLILLSLILFIFVPFSLQNTGYENAVVEEIELIFRKQKLNYKNIGNFIDRYSDISNKKSYITRNYKVEMKKIGNRLIVAIRHNSLTSDRQKTSFGFIKILRSKQIQHPNKNNNKRGLNKTQWEYLDMASFICSSKKLGTPLPSDIEFNNISDKCPVGYTQSSIKQDKIHHHKTTDGVAKSDSFGKV